jgi:hypothetical protein
MATGPEAAIIKKILKLLRDRGAYAVKIHGEIRQATTVDILACYRGRFIGIEAKAKPTLKPTDRQRQVMTEIIEAGGTAFVTAEPQDVIEALELIDEEISASWLED